MLRKVEVVVVVFVVLAAAVVLLRSTVRVVKAGGAQHVLLSEPAIAVGHFTPAKDGKGFTLVGGMDGDIRYPEDVHVVWYTAMRPVPNVLVVSFRHAPGGRVTAEILDWQKGRLVRVAHGGADVDFPGESTVIVRLQQDRKGVARVLSLTVSSGKEPAAVSVKYVLVARQREEPWP